MDSLGHRPTSPLCNAARTTRILVHERRDYLVGIVLLLVVVFLWALANFVTQVCTDSFDPMRDSPLYFVGHFPRRIRETLLVRGPLTVPDLLTTIRLVLQGYVVGHELVRFLPYTGLVEEVVGEGVTRYVCSSHHAPGF